MLVYFMETWSILRSSVIFYVWTFGIVRGNLVCFPRFWYFVPRKIWQPWSVKRSKPCTQNPSIAAGQKLQTFFFGGGGAQKKFFQVIENLDF
jgi:hypothetical protein